MPIASRAWVQRWGVTIIVICTEYWYGKRNTRERVAGRTGKPAVPLSLTQTLSPLIPATDPSTTTRALTPRTWVSAPASPLPSRPIVASTPSKHHATQCCVARTCHRIHVHYGRIQYIRSSSPFPAPVAAVPASPPSFWRSTLVCSHTLGTSQENLPWSLLPCPCRTTAEESFDFRGPSTDLARSKTASELGSRRHRPEPRFPLASLSLQHCLKPSTRYLHCGQGNLTLRSTTEDGRQLHFIGLLRNSVTSSCKG